MDVEIGEVKTEVTVSENVGALSAEEVKRIVKLVVQHLQDQKNSAEERENDTAIRDRAFHPKR